MVVVEWGVFSLSIQNWDTERGEFDPERARGIAALRTVITVRDHGGNAAVDAYYAAIGERVFDRLQSANDHDTIRGALADAGLDPGLVDRALGDSSTWERLRAEHDALVNDTRSFGVPTIRLDGGTGPAIFGPVISNPPPDDDAVALWEHVSWLTRYENFSELKRDRTIDPDLESYREHRRRQG